MTAGAAPPRRPTCCASKPRLPAPGPVVDALLRRAPRPTGGRPLMARVVAVSVPESAEPAPGGVIRRGMPRRPKRP